MGTITQLKHAVSFTGDDAVEKYAPAAAVLLWSIMTLAVFFGFGPTGEGNAVYGLLSTFVGGYLKHHMVEPNRAVESASGATEALRKTV